MPHMPHDYFAELFVAGRFADTGWNVYFPHRDEGFDFVVAKDVGRGHQLIRPVQVKGKYPREDKKDKTVYGYIGDLSQVHPEMVLAIPFFATGATTPSCVAYLPLSLIRQNSRGFRSQPAAFKSGVPSPRRDYRRFFDDDGLRLIERSEWPTMRIQSD